MQRGARTNEQAEGAVPLQLLPALAPLLGGVLALLITLFGGAPRYVEASVGRAAPELRALSRPPPPVVESRNVSSVPTPGASDALPPPLTPRPVLPRVPVERQPAQGREATPLTLAELGRRQTDGG